MSLGTELLATRPFGEDFVTVLPRRYIDRHEIARHRYLVEADTTNAGDFCVKPGVVVAEETHSRARAGNGLGEAFSFALEPTADGAVGASPCELDAGGGLVDNFLVVNHFKLTISLKQRRQVIGQILGWSQTTMINLVKNPGRVAILHILLEKIAEALYVVSKKNRRASHMLIIKRRLDG